MELGLFNLMPQRDLNKPISTIYSEMTDQVKLAEAVGFDVAWFAEHHFSNYCLCPSPLMMAAYMAGQTSRIKLGPAVLVLQLYEPIRLLEDISTVDQLSGGRLVLGFGSGYQQYEFHRFGLDVKQGRAHFLEMLDVIEAFYGEAPLSYDGKYVKIPESYFSLHPKELNPPMYVAGLMSDEQTQQRIARSGYTPFVTTGWNPLATIQNSRDVVVRAHAAVGKDTTNVPFAMQQYIYVTDSEDEMLEAADHARYVRRVAMGMRFQYAEVEGAFLKEAPAKDEPDLETIAANLLVGSPDKIAARMIEECEVLRPTHLSCFMAFGGLDGARVLRSMERFAEEVLPQVVAHFGSLEAISDGAPRRIESNAA